MRPPPIDISRWSWAGLFGILLFLSGCSATMVPMVPPQGRSELQVKRDMHECERELRLINAPQGVYQECLESLGYTSK